MTLEQAKVLVHGQHVLSTKATYANGSPCQVRITGSVRTWKRDPNRVVVPWKYGMYEYGHITEHTLADWVLEKDADAFFMDQYEARRDATLPDMDCDICGDDCGTRRCF